MKKGLLFVFLLGVFYGGFSQAPLVKQWDKRFGGTDYEQLFDFQQTIDIGYILGGFSNSNISGDKTQATWGNQDYWIVKIDFLGNKQWDKRFGGTSDDLLYSLQQTTDSGYILGGYSFSGIGGDKTQASWGGWDYWVVKIDSLGNKQWDKSFGGTGYDELYSLQQTFDGGYILGGHSKSGISGDKMQASWGGADYWIVKIDFLGNKQWDKRFGGTDDDILTCLQQTTDGGYILGGSSDSNIGGDKTQTGWGVPDYWIVKVDSLGTKQWDKRFGGANYEALNSLLQTTDRGYILGGCSNSGIGGDKSQAGWGGLDFWIVKIDSLGNKQWDKNFGGTSNEDDFGNITRTADGGYLIAGTSYSPISGDKTENNLGQEQTWVVKIDSLGNKQWDKTLFTLGHDETGFAIQAKDECYAMANRTSGGVAGYKTQSSQGDWDYWIIKFCDSTQGVLPNANFISSDTTFCIESGNCIDFTDQSTNNPTSWQWDFPGAVPDTSTQQNPTNICYATPGTYAVKLIVSNSNGTDSLTVSPMITFAASAAPPVLTFSGDTIYCSYAAAYQWYLDGLPISFATDSFYVITGDGVYAVLITDGNGCSRLSDGFPVSVNELSGAGGINIYPNPAGSELWVVSYGLWVNSRAMLEISNVLGEIVYSTGLTTHNSQPKSRIDVSFLSKGIYIVEVRDGEKVYRTKMVKQ